MVDRRHCVGRNLAGYTLMPFERKMTDEQKREAMHLYCWGMSLKRLAKKYGVSTGLISNAIRKIQNDRRNPTPA
jgi:transposase-like protein